MPMNPMQMLMGNSPLPRMINAMRSGGNPLEVVKQLSGGNSVMEQGLGMIMGKSPEQVKQLAMNMAQQRGVDVNAMLHQMGLR